MQVSEYQLTKFFQSYGKGSLFPRRDGKPFNFYIRHQKYNAYPRFHLIIKQISFQRYTVHIHIDWDKHSAASKKHPLITEILKRIKGYEPSIAKSRR